MVAHFVEKDAAADVGLDGTAVDLVHGLRRKARTGYDANGERMIAGAVRDVMDRPHLQCRSPQGPRNALGGQKGVKVNIGN